MDEVQFQMEVFKLRDQEYPYYYQVGQGPRIPLLLPGGGQGWV